MFKSTIGNTQDALDFQWQSKPKQPGETHSDLGNAYGNQALLQMKRASRMPPVMSLRPSQTLGLQRKSAFENENPKLAIGSPTDALEQEADQVADQIMRMPEGATEHLPLSLLAFRKPKLQRKCSKCEETEKGVLQSKSEQTSGDLDAGKAARVAEQEGMPLAKEVRSFFEPRFGHDFSQVRVHVDGEAAHGAKAIQARAYTLGKNIVFGSGEYSPVTAEGKRLLAHELTHIIQQGSSKPKGENSSGPLYRSNISLAQPTVQRDDIPDAGADVADAGTEAPVPLESPPSKKGICGPVVTKQLSNGMTNLRTTFNGLAENKRDDLCEQLTDSVHGLVTWDFLRLHVRDWMEHEKCATIVKNATEPCCANSVQVNDDCYYAGSPNYVLFGGMCKLCFDHYVAKPGDNLSDISNFTSKSMLSLIEIYKSDAWNFKNSQGWALAGYNGWPAGGTPPSGDCSADCATTCGPFFIKGAVDNEAFRPRWCPHIDPVGSCKSKTKNIRDFGEGKPQ